MLEKWDNPTLNSITFECEIITPVLMTGASKNNPELRASSIKGVLRFWWRALHGHLSLEELRKQEAEIFGGTGAGEGKSSFSIRMTDQLVTQNSFPMLPHKSGNKKAYAQGITGSFRVKFLSQTDLGFSLRDLFTLVTGLSGFGKRSRRGFGSIRITKTDENAFSFTYSLDSLCELLNSLTTSKYVVSHNIIKREKDPAAHNEAAYPYLKTIQIGNPFQDRDTLLKTIGDSSHENNSYYTGFSGQHGKRLSSPVYVSTIKNKEKSFTPVITCLNPCFENRPPPKNEAGAFIKYILEKGMGSKS